MDRPRADVATWAAALALVAVSLLIIWAVSA